MKSERDQWVILLSGMTDLTLLIGWQEMHVAYPCHFSPYVLSEKR